MQKICAYVVVFCLLVAAAGNVSAVTVCGNNGLSGAPSQAIPFETIDKGMTSYYRYGDPHYHGAEMVIRNKQSWEWFWKAHTQTLSPPPPLPKVNFARQVVLVVMLGYQSSQGPGIEIRSVERLCSGNGSSIKGIRVSVQESRTQGLPVVLTNPYHVVTVPKHEVFVFEHELFFSTCDENARCGTDEYCVKQPGDCSGNGICEPMPGVCGENYAPVCGCDGKTYSNACKAADAGISVALKGACEIQEQHYGVIRLPLHLTDGFE